MVCYTAAVQLHTEDNVQHQFPVASLHPPPPPTAHLHKNIFFDKHCVSDWPQSGCGQKTAGLELVL